MTGTTGRWEYHVEKFDGAIEVERLNELGNDRWELVSIAPDVGNAQVVALIFKRPTPTLAEQITLDQRTRVQGEAGVEQS